MDQDSQNPYRLRSTRTETAERLKKHMQQRRRRWEEYALFEEEPDDDLSRGDPSTNPYIPRSRRLRDRIRRMREARGNVSYHEMWYHETPKGEKLKFYAFVGLSGLIVLGGLWRHFTEKSIKSISYTVTIEAENTAEQAAGKLRKLLHRTARFKVVKGTANIKIYIGATQTGSTWT